MAIDEKFQREYGIGCFGKHIEGFTLDGAQANYAPDLSLEPKHTEVRLEFDIPEKQARGTVTHTVYCNLDGARSLKFNGVALESVEISDPSGAELAWRYDGREIIVTWEAPFRAREERRVAIRYQVTQPISGLFFSEPDAHYPNRAVYVVSDHETERARYWLPCVDYPTVRTRFDFHLTAAEDLTFLANGVLVGETRDGRGKKTAHWRLDFPCPSYLCCIAIGGFVSYEDEKVGDCPIVYFATEDYTTAELRRTFGRTPKMLRWIQKRLGHPFPFPKYYQLAHPEMGGAMENISLVTWTDYCMLDEKWALELTDQVDSINLHEMAHSYFGDALVCRHFEHSWLKESWAVFMETVYLEENVSRDERDYDLCANALGYFDEANNRYVRPIVTRSYTSSWDLFDRHLYPGGAWRIHMLREKVGAEPFWNAVKDYLDTYQNGLVETDDFRRKLEAHSGINLTRFFDEWIYSAGYPKLKVSFTHDNERAEMTLIIEQCQRDDRRGVGLFRFDLEIAVESDGEWRTHTLAMESARHALALPMRSPPRQVLIDPEMKTLFALEFSPGEDLLKRSITEAKRMNSRVWAAGELIKTGTRANFAAVKDAMLEEPFYGARALVAALLGASKSVEVIPVLAELLLAEREPRAMASFAASCGKLRDERLRVALLEFLKGDLPYRARATALDSLGAQRDPRDFELLRAAADDDGRHSLVKNGAFAGLAQLRTERAFQELRARLPYGKEPETARPALVTAFGGCALLQEREQKEQAGELLVDLTRDPQPRVRLRAAAALAQLGGMESVTAQAIPALSALQKIHPFQDFPVIERNIRKLRGGGSEEAVALKKQMEELQERFRKMEERMDGADAGSAAAKLKEAAGGKTQRKESAGGKQKGKKGKRKKGKSGRRSRA